MRKRTHLAVAAVIMGCAAGVNTASSPTSGPRTRAERTNYLETSHYADVIAFLDSLKGRPELEFGSIGRTNEGRDIPYVIASRPRVATPEAARALNRPIVYIQGNIHAGEVEGKEALLMMLRDLTSSSRPNVLDSVVFIAVPIYNADGNEKFASQEKNRGSQNGPEMVGVRTNAQNLDLNRDYIKAEAPETRASLAMFNRWDPDLFVDLHTTDGSYHGYALTYAPPLNPASPLGDWTRDSIMPVLRERMQSRHNFATFDYGDFIDDDTLSKGWVTFDSRPRFGTNYYGLRGKTSILSEAYSHDPFERRVKSTYAFVQEILSLAAEKSAGLRRWWLSSEVPIRSEMVPAPDSIGVIAEIMERTGDSTRTQPGVPKGRRRTGRFITVRMPVFDRFRPTLMAPRLVRYVIPAADTQIVRVLRAHGIVVTEASSSPKDMLTGDGYVFMIDSTVQAQRPFQGHREMRLTGKWRRDTRPITPGQFVVDTSQPLGLLAVYLLEPQSDDGLVTWNYFDTELKPGGLYPVLKIGGAPPTP
ncbi:MAG TPA: M14 family metallopeptidase [Gemmatimonadaceae bacterium]